MATGRENQRVVDAEGNMPSVHGGGLYTPLSQLRLSRGDDDDALLLLETEGNAPEALPEEYSLLTSGKYSACLVNSLDSQGSCNSCWAFATQSAMQARLCKANIDKGVANPLVQLSPLNLICHLQRDDDVEICDPKRIDLSLEYARDKGILKYNWVQSWINGRFSVAREREWKKGGIRLPSEAMDTPRRREPSSWGAAPAASQAPRGRAAVQRGSRSLPRTEFYTRAFDRRIRNAEAHGDLAKGLAAVTADVSHPSRKSCEELFVDASFESNLVQAPRVLASASPPSSFARQVIDLKRRLLWGPVVGTVRLTWEFLQNTAALFNPSRRQTFCRQARAEDFEDYCSPARKGSWDAAQAEQQEPLPAGLSPAEVDARMETWYNHFVTLHGWGIAPGDEPVPYWVVENSWGRIYDNDPALGNNGAGASYTTTFTVNGAAVVNDKNHFVLIAQRVSGRGGLEITSREVYTIQAK